MSPQYSFDKANLLHTLKVAGWSAASAVIVVIAAYVTSNPFPPQYAFLVTIANTLIVGIEQWVSSQEKVA